MVYETKRSATVMAQNYLTSAKISREKYSELIEIYPQLNDYVSKHILKYDDPLKLWMEISLNEIPFFKPLPKYIKNEFIFNMRRNELEKGNYLYKIDQLANDMCLLQSGKLEISHYAKGYDDT